MNETRRRWRTLRNLERWLETPMLVLSFVWLVIVGVELIWGENTFLGWLGTGIWIAFIFEFTVRLVLAPNKWIFLQRNWLTAIALLAPALRLFRIFRIFRLARGLRLVRIVGTANRGMNALRASLSRRGLGYVLVLTVLITLLGAGGMLAFEPAREVEGGFTGYLDALWWTAMLISTMGSSFWPQSPEGRVLCFLLSLYGLAVFGYITASFASFFVTRDSEEGSGMLSNTEAAGLRAAIASLRAELHTHHDVMTAQNMKEGQ